MFVPTSIDHLVFRVRDLDRTERFYEVLLGKPLKGEGYLIYMAGGTRLFFTPAPVDAPPYDKDDVGLNHIALAVPTLEELERVQSQLNEASVTHSGIKFWKDGLTRYIWLDDPDGIRVEYWLRLPE
jgi:catechol-2,3-dioxygenase